MPRSREEVRRAARALAQQARERVAEEFGIPVEEVGESGSDMLGQNNEGELLIALNRIKEAMLRGATEAEATRVFGIPGHPYFADYWPVTEIWGDAAAPDLD